MGEKKTPKLLFLTCAHFRGVNVSPCLISSYQWFNNWLEKFLKRYYLAPVSGYKLAADDHSRPGLLCFRAVLCKSCRELQ